MLIYGPMSFICPLCLALLFLATSLWAEPLSLREGLKIVTDDSRIIRIRQQEERASEMDTYIARARLFPSVNAGYVQSHLDQQPGMRIGPLSANTAERDSYSYNVSIQQILWDFKGVASLYQSSRMLLDAKRLDTRRTRNGVALEFTLLYFNLLESERLIEVAQKERETLQSHLAIARELFSQGVITRNDLLQAEVKLSDADQKLITAKNVRRIAGARLNNLLTRPLTTPVEVAEVEGIRTNTTPVETAWEMGERERPELQIADATIKAIDFEEKSVRSEYLPRLLARGGYDYTKNKFQIHEEYWSINLLASINLFSGGSTNAQVAKLEATKARLRIEKTKLTEDVRLEIEKYYLDLINSLERISVTKGATAQAEENLRITRIKYTEGVGLATDVTDAITLLTLAQTNYYRSLYDYYRSEAGYVYSMGKDLKDYYSSGQRQVEQ